MASFLHENATQFRAIVLACAEALDISPAFVVKDYFITVLLREITVRNPDVVFKGGTCLSKCYGAIARFSEDIDLGMAEEHVTEGMRRKMKRCVVESVEAVGLSITNLNQTRSNREFNKFIVELPAFDFENVTPLIIETAVMTPASPCVVRPLRSFIYDWAEAEGPASEIVAYADMAPYEIHSNALERTFADKVFAICDYYLDEEPIPARQSRHIYDLYKLLGLVSLDDELLRLMETVRAQRAGRHRCPSAEPDVSLSDVLSAIIAEEAYRQDYEGVTRGLLYEEVPYEVAVTSLSRIAEWLESSDRF